MSRGRVRHGRLPVRSDDGAASTLGRRCVPRRELGSFLSEAIGWRGVFLAAALLGTGCLLLQAVLLPPLRPELPDRRSGVVAVARRPGVAGAMLALFCVFAASMSFFTYRRPFYQQVTGLGVPALSRVLLGFGVANAIGTALSGWALTRSLFWTLVGAPLGMVPVGWSTWVARTLGDGAENAGGCRWQ